MSLQFKASETKKKRGLGATPDWWEAVIRDEKGEIFAVAHGETKEDAEQRADYITFNCF
jgi:hypothetical protein